MLSRITIRDLIIVRHLDLAFESGMSALTGETGAGKSILVDALGLALGDTADSGMIRSGADKADISVAFELDPASPLHAWLDTHDFAADGECLLRRVLVRDGRSRAYINGTPATRALLRELGSQLVDIHGQHAHQSLLQTTAQRDLLDSYAGLGERVREVGQCHQAWRAAVDAYETLRRAGDDRASRLDYLRFQVAEMDGVVCDSDALRDLENEHARLAHAERLIGDSAALLDTLSDTEPSLYGSLSQVVQKLGELTQLDKVLADAHEMLDSAAIQVDEAVSALRHYSESVDLDPQRLQTIDERLGQLHDLARKHRVEAGELGPLLDRLKDEIVTLENADSSLAGLEQAMLTAQAAYRDAARKLGKARRSAAKRLSKTVSDSMQMLGMVGGQFRIEVDSDEARPAASGIDKVDFLVAANPGQPEGRLANVASGGELSRISLAIQVATANCGRVPTLIFDEVDVGIGGAVAEIVGQLLRTLGSERQVLCVTHLAQVASQAHQQLRVHKITDGKHTETRIDRLDETARIDEVARMMGGVSITEQTRRHADEMIRAAGRSA